MLKKFKFFSYLIVNNVLYKHNILISNVYKRRTLDKY